jgi:hypothetical protein
LDDISLISYYLNVLASYATYYWAYYRDSFRDYPYEVQTAIVIIQWSSIAVVFLIALIEKKGHHRRLKERTIEMLEEHYGEAIDYVFDREHNWPMSRDEIHGRFDVDEQQVAKKGLLRNKLQKQMMCHIIYHRLIASGNTWTNRRKNVHLLLNIFSLPAFLEQEVAFANLFIKMKALAAVRAAYFNAMGFRQTIEERFTNLEHELDRSMGSLRTLQIPGQSEPADYVEE